MKNLKFSFSLLIQNSLKRSLKISAPAAYVLIPPEPIHTVENESIPLALPPAPMKKEALVVENPIKKEKKENRGGVSVVTIQQLKKVFPHTVSLSPPFCFWIWIDPIEKETFSTLLEKLSEAINLYIAPCGFLTDHNKTALSERDFILYTEIKKEDPLLKEQKNILPIELEKLTKDPLEKKKLWDTLLSYRRFIPSK